MKFGFSKRWLLLVPVALIAGCPDPEDVSGTNPLPTAKPTATASATTPLKTPNPTVSGTIVND